MVYFFLYNICVDTNNLSFTYYFMCSIHHNKYTINNLNRFNILEISAT